MSELISPFFYDLLVWDMLGSCTLYDYKNMFSHFLLVFVEFPSYLKIFDRRSRTNFDLEMT